MPWEQDAAPRGEPLLTRDGRALWPCRKHEDTEPLVSVNVRVRRTREPAPRRIVLLMQCSICGDPWEL